MGTLSIQRPDLGPHRPRGSVAPGAHPALRAFAAACLALGLAACTEAATSADADAGQPATSDTGPSEAGVLDAGLGDAGDADAGEADAGPSRLDESLARVLAELTVPVAALDPHPAELPAVVALGEMLFFDPILSGNKDTACASCHQSESASSDSLPLALGTGASGRGLERAQGNRPEWGRRRSPGLWNRGRLPALFWDGRVSRSSTTAGPPLPRGITDPLAMQALHPILDPTEMLGRPGQLTTDGLPNELAGLPAEMVYQGLQARLTAIAGYAPLFEAAFPGQGVTMQGILTALAAFERTRFDVSDTPWDRYLRGDLHALSDAAKLGAQVFFGAGKCGQCHQGPELTDHRFHNVGVPLLEPIDEGRGLIDGPQLRYAFRTPPLRNAAASPPFMHNGTMATLQDVLRHYSNPELTAGMYTGQGLPEDLAARIVTSSAALTALNDSLSEDLPVASRGSTPVGLSNVRQFLLHLVDEAALERARQMPSAVPSGRPVGGR